ncbi:hypothetical protein QRO11_09880 [Paracidovorax citrulli]|uniref:hypothetical protein n=1 Tax=Paracidovorax citrulli TaxID=80869 RepID=UPI00255D0A0A|nr:hypothetical protein [Paracidovorax citrulli]WIY36601.1 hypothetical protein QRO11_09880 [Paracidovorax citrulli]
MLKEWTWRVMVGSEVPDIVKQLRDLEAAQSSTPEARARVADFRQEVFRECAWRTVIIAAIYIGLILTIQMCGLYDVAQSFLLLILDHAIPLFILFCFACPLLLVDFSDFEPWLNWIGLAIIGAVMVTLILFTASVIAFAIR